MKTNPSDFATVSPMNSVFKKAEHEIVARNIMIILKRYNKDKFKLLTWEEYKEIREQTGTFNNIEKVYFDDVIPYTISADMARRFSDCWQ